MNRIAVVTHFNGTQSLKTIKEIFSIGQEYKQERRKLRALSEWCAWNRVEGQEQYEPCTWGFGRKRERVIHYEYRHTNGKLFGCFAKTIDECRSKRDEWLEKQAL